MSSLRLSKGEMIADIRRVARLLSHSPSSVEYRLLGQYNVRTLQKRFRAPWPEIVEAAGLCYTPRTCRKIPSTEELRNDLKRVARELGHAPTRFEYEALGRFGSETVRRRSGERLWEEAVAALAGLDREEVKTHQCRGGLSYRTTAERLSQLRELSCELGHAPTTQEANNHGLNAHQLRRRIGGGWEAVLKAAGIDVRKRSRHALSRSVTAEALIEDVVAVARRLGRMPTARQYEERGRYSYAVVRRRLRGWREMKRAVGEITRGELCQAQCRHTPGVESIGLSASPAE